MLVLHHNDADGRCSAAVVYHRARQEQHTHWRGLNPIGKTYGDAFDARWEEVRFFETDYKTPAPVEQIKPGEPVVIVDFSYQPAEMARILAVTADVTWCDHHVTAAAFDYGRVLPGVRDFADKSRAGCECTWAHFFPNQPVPLGLRLLGDYDSWRFALGENRAKAFYEGLKLQDQSPNGLMWERLFRDETYPEMITEDGCVAEKYRDSYCAEMARSYGYETELPSITSPEAKRAWAERTFNECPAKGWTNILAEALVPPPHRAFALNAYKFGSPGFGSLFKQYPVCIAYVHDGRKFTVSLYSETVDVSGIAKLWGGGGHKGAAGFVCDMLPFKPKEKR